MLPERHRFGLQNIGNTCYINSVLQCLLYIYPLNQFFATITFNGLSHAIASKAYKDLVRYMWFNNSQALSISTRTVKHAVSQKNNRFKNFDQEDAQEFLSCLLTQLNEELRALDSNTTVISEIFHGQLDMVMKCCTCAHELRTPNPFNFIPVPIVSDETMLENDDEHKVLVQTNAAPLELIHCLRRFMFVKPINNNYFCNNHCQNDAKALRRLELVKLPPTMIIQLERFFDNINGIRLKRDTFVNFPIDGLDMSSFVSSNYPTNLSNIYDLIGAIEHTGIHGFGHYTAVARQQDSAIWHRFDDSRVTAVERCDIVTKNAYVLFYMRRINPHSDMCFSEHH